MNKWHDCWHFFIIFDFTIVSLLFLATTMWVCFIVHIQSGLVDFQINRNSIQKMSFIYYLSFRFYCEVFTVENKKCFDRGYLFDYWLIPLLYYPNEWMKLFIHLLGICLCYFSLSLKLFLISSEICKEYREHWILHHTS